MSHYLIVDAWHKGLDNKEQVDKLINFCKTYKISDLVVQVRRRIYEDLLEKYDFLQYLIDSLPTCNLYAYISTFCNAAWYKGKNPLPENWLIKPFPPIWMINPEVYETHDYIADICKNLVLKYKIKGIFAEKLYYYGKFAGKEPQDKRLKNIKDMTSTISKAIKLANPSSLLLGAYECYGASYEDSCNEDAVEWKEFLSEGIIDIACPMLFQDSLHESDFEAWISQVPKDKTIPILGCYMIPVSVLRQRIQKLSGYDIGLYSYNCFSKSKLDTEAEFGEVCQL